MNNQENAVECTKLMNDLKILQRPCNLSDAIEVTRSNQLDTRELVLKSALQTQFK